MFKMLLLGFFVVKILLLFIIVFRRMLVVWFLGGLFCFWRSLIIWDVVLLFWEFGYNVLVFFCILVVLDMDLNVFRSKVIFLEVM